MVGSAGQHHASKSSDSIRGRRLLLSSPMSDVDGIINLESSISSELLAGLYGLYNLIAVVTVLAFDILETFDDEIIHVWRKKFGMTGLLYTLARYIPFIINMALLIVTLSINTQTADNVTARTLNLLYCIPWFIVLACTEYLFIIRAVAQNGNSRWLRYTLIVLYVAEVIISFSFYIFNLPASSGFSTNEVVISTDSPPIITPLDIVLFPKFISPLAFGLPELAFQSILVLVIIYALIRHRKTWTASSLANIIVRDGLWGYFFNLFGLLVVIIQPFWLAGPAGQPSIQWSYVTFSVTSSRLLLNIRSGAGDPGVRSNNVSLNSLYFNGGRRTEETH